MGYLLASLIHERRNDVDKGSQHHLPRLPHQVYRVLVAAQHDAVTRTDQRVRRQVLYLAHVPQVPQCLPYPLEALLTTQKRECAECNHIAE